ncbi:MAG: type II toxin-antitoxin system HipA family toxin [Fimbriimonadaceae bacterium]
MTGDAVVYQGDSRVAHITRTPTGSRLDFEPSVVVDPPPYPGYLAWTLPYGIDPVEQSGDNLHPFFVNLLPEGARLRLLLGNTRLAGDDFLGLLLTVGADTIGDVSVVPEGHPPASLAKPTVGGPPESLSFWDLFYAGAQVANPDAAIPGVQEKISSQTIAFAAHHKRWPGAILKLNPSRYPRLVQNEAFFLRMAAACGIEAAQAELCHDREGETGLLVRRFDRVRAGRNRLQKLHQEDVCQLLGTMPANKYSVSLRQVADALRAVCTSPVAAVAELLRRYAFSYLIGNGDLHAKNVSVMWAEDVVRLTPAYDLLSTLPYPSLPPRMALKLDGKDLNLGVDDFVRFAERYGVPPAFVNRMLGTLCERSDPWIARLGEIGLDPPETERLAEAIRHRQRELSP